MTMEAFYVMIGGFMVLGAFAIFCAVYFALKKQKSFELVQGKLQNNDTDDIYDAVQRLKLTNQMPANSEDEK